jgi:hypothetical protein
MMSQMILPIVSMPGILRWLSFFPGALSAESYFVKYPSKKFVSQSFQVVDMLFFSSRDRLIRFKNSYYMICHSDPFFCFSQLSQFAHFDQDQVEDLFKFSEPFVACSSCNSNKELLPPRLDSTTIFLSSESEAQLFSRRKHLPGKTTA